MHGVDFWKSYLVCVGEIKKKEKMACEWEKKKRWLFFSCTNNGTENHYDELTEDIPVWISALDRILLLQKPVSMGLCGHAILNQSKMCHLESLIPFWVLLHLGLGRGGSWFQDSWVQAVLKKWQVIHTGLSTWEISSMWRPGWKR